MMPSKTAKQHYFMALCSRESGRKKAKGKCPPKKMAMEFMHADKGRKFTRKKK